MLILFVGIRLLMYMLSLAHLDAELRVAPVRELAEPDVERGADGLHALLHRG